MKESYKEDRVRPLLFSAGTIAAILIVTVGIRWVAQWLDPFDDRPFTTAAWKQTTSYKSRASMSRDLVNNHLGRGMSKTEVIAILGQPGMTKQGDSNIDDNVPPGLEAYLYGIGSWSLYGMDDAFVYVHFNSSQKVVEAEINGY